MIDLCISMKYHDLLDNILGCNVVIASRKPDRLEQAAESIEDRVGDKSGVLKTVVCNIRKEEEVCQQTILFFN